VVPDYYEDSKLGSGWITVTHKKKRAAPLIGASTVVTAVVAATAAVLPTAHASPMAFHMEEPQEFWAQMVAAVAIWACFVLARHLSRGNRRCARTINNLTGFAVSLWTAQASGWTISVSTLWDLAVRTNLAPYLATVTIMACAAFAYLWRRAEQKLFTNALRS
jgi:FtsH-binding integral membrane protein